jgi:hypothetical protein
MPGITGHEYYCAANWRSRRRLKPQPTSSRAIHAKPTYNEIRVSEGVLPGPLRVPRRASALRRMLVTTDKYSNDPMNVVDWVNMFALAVNEENAAGGRVVTAPTNGACGIVPDSKPDFAVDGADVEETNEDF